MTIEALIVWLVIGAIAGFLAGLIVTGYGFGTVGNMVVGILGALLGGAAITATWPVSWRRHRRPDY